MRGNYEKDIGGLENEETPADDLARPAPPHKGAGGGFNRSAHAAGPGPYGALFFKKYTKNIQNTIYYIF